jgi:hypothetical protein
MIEPSRRHGHFDPRFSIRLASATRRVDEVPGGLDWAAFAGRLFPGPRRHDFQALRAYEAYKDGSYGVDEPAKDRETVLVLVETG